MLCLVGWLPSAAMEVIAVTGLPRIAAGDDLAEIILRLAPLHNGDVLVVASKVLSLSQGRLVDLDQVEASEQAMALAAETGKDPRLVELILEESLAISRAAPGVLVVRHRLGHICANAGVDQSNASGRIALLPVDPDGWAAEVRNRAEADIGVVVSDTVGRPFRRGAVGTAIGVAGVPAIVDLRGRRDLDQRVIEHSEQPVADILAAAADLVMGQADEGVPAAVIRGVSWSPTSSSAADLQRDPDLDLYA